MTFNGFISYSHAADGRLAPAVQRGLHRLAKPWHRRRALWIFRDQTGLSVTPALWSSIQAALDGSDYFVLLASPEAARSQWVNREIEHWITTKSADQILPVVTDGAWAWDQEARDFTEDSTAVPAALRGVFAEEPLFLDLRWARGTEHLSLQHSRFRDAIAQLAAPMHGVSKDELEGEDVRQHRRARRLRSGGVATLVVLTLLATLTGMSAVRNAERARNAAAEALRQQRVAEEQRGSAERSAQESHRQQERAQQQQELAQQQQDLARQQRARAAAAAAAADRSERLARKQQKLADQAAAEARRQQRLADQAATRTREQQRLAKEATARAQRLQKEAQRLQEEAQRLAKVAAEHRRLAQEAAAEAEKQQLNADRQQRIAVSRRLINQAKATVGADPKTALMLGAAAQRLQPDTETLGELTGVIVSTGYAGTLADVTWAAYGPRGVLATLGNDGGVSLWNVTDRTRPVRLATLGDRGAVDGFLTFSPDGRTLAVVGSTGAAVLWDVAHRSRPVRLATLPGDGRVRAMAFSGDGNTLATGHGSGSLTVWDLADRARPAALATLRDWGAYPVEDLAFSPDGRTLVMNKVRFVQAYDLTERADPVALLGLPGFSVASMAFSPDGTTLATGGFDGKISIYGMTPEATAGATRREPPGMPPPPPGMPPPPPGMPPLPPDAPSPPDMPPPVEPYYEPVDVLSGLTGAVDSVAFSSDGRLLAAGDGSGTATVWQDRTPLTSVRAHGRITTVAFDSDAQTLVTADSSATATLWHVPPRGAPDRLAALALPGEATRVTAFGPGGRSLIAVGYDGTAKSWNVTDPAHPDRGADRTVHGGRVRAAAISPDNRMVAAVGAEDGQLTLTDVTRPNRPVTLTAPAGSARGTNAMAFSPDGRTLAVADATRVLLWNVADPVRPTLLATLSGGAGIGTTVAFSPDGRTLATGDNRALTLWNVAARSAPVRLATLTGHTDSLRALAFGPNGRTLASGSADNTAMLWDVTDRARPQRVATLTGHRGPVGSVTFGPDGHTLATGSTDQAVTLWDTTNPAGPVRLASMRAGLGGEVRAVAFRRDGRTLAVTSQSRPDSATVTLWSYTKLNKLRADPAGFACTITGRGFTAGEWARHIPEFPHRRTCTG